MLNISSKDWLSISEAARACGVAPSTVNNWVRLGRLQAHRMGPRGRWRIRQADLRQYAGECLDARGTFLTKGGLS